MFETRYITDDQSYIVADYDSFSLTVWVLVFEKRKPKLLQCVRTFFDEKDRVFRPNTFEQRFAQCCDELAEKIWTSLPRDVCLFLDHPELVITSTWYTFARSGDQPVTLEEIDNYVTHLTDQSRLQAKRLWYDECGYSESDRKLISVFLSHLALDKRHYTFPLGKLASHVTLRCLFFYGSRQILDSLARSISATWKKLISTIPLPCIFLNHLCNKDTFLENHLHIHLGYQSTHVLLHLGKKIQEIQTMPFWWKVLDEKLGDIFSPLERESHILSNPSMLYDLPEWKWYQEFLTASLLSLFERFGFQWSFQEYSVSSQWSPKILADVVSLWWLSPWIQKNAHMQLLWANQDDHWLHYINTLDPLFTINPHPLLSLLRSAIFSE